MGDPFDSYKSLPSYYMDYMHTFIPAHLYLSPHDNSTTWCGSNDRKCNEA